MYTAEIICVGTELLLGSITNTNAPMISRELASLGIAVYYQTVVGDNPKRLGAAVDVAKKRADIIITTGGLGPTYDDLTKEVLASSFGLCLRMDQRSKERICERFLHMSRPMTDNNLRQAMLPEGCEVFDNDWGTAPGCAFYAEGTHVLMLPGPPRECEAMFTHRAVLYLKAQGLCEGMVFSKTLKLFGIGESAMEAALPQDIVELSNPTVAPYAKFGECELRISARSKSKDEAKALISPVEERIKAIFGSDIYGVDVDSLEERVSELLREQKLTVSAAESCTGGLVSKRITDLPGATAVFRGGIVCYTVELKASELGVSWDVLKSEGPVSSECACQMALGCRRLCGSDLALSITGLAGPDGDEFGAVGGQVYIGLAYGEDASCVIVKECNFGHDRGRVRQMAAHTALDMVRRFLEEKVRS